MAYFNYYDAACDRYLTCTPTRELNPNRVSQDVSDSRDSMTRSVDYHHDGKPSQNTGNQVKRVHGGDGECGNACGTDPL